MSTSYVEHDRKSMTCLYIHTGVTYKQNKGLTETKKNLLRAYANHPAKLPPTTRPLR